MGLFSFLRKKRERTNVQGDQPVDQLLENKQALEKISSDVENLKAQVNTVNIALKKHDDQFIEHRKVIDQHSEQFEKLEEKVNTIQIAPADVKMIPDVRPIQLPNTSTIPASTDKEPAQKFDINRFSQQQKRILAVFFQNQDMTLSYADIGKILNKSPLTIKNQMREIRLKANLFDRSIGEQNRHRFKLKKDLRIEKYLNLS